MQSSLIVFMRLVGGEQYTEVTAIRWIQSSRHTSQKPIIDDSSVSFKYSRGQPLHKYSKACHFLKLSVSKGGIIG